MHQLFARQPTKSVTATRLPARVFVARYIAGVICFILAFSFIAYFSGTERSLDKNLLWGHSFVPEILQKRSANSQFSFEDRFVLAVLDMQPNFSYPDSNAALPSSLVKTDEEIIVIGRTDVSTRTSYVLADATGSFNQSCRMQSGGRVTGLAHNSDYALLAYSAPPSGRSGIGTCAGNEIFFLPWRDS